MFVLISEYARGFELICDDDDDGDVDADVDIDVGEDIFIDDINSDKDDLNGKGFLKRNILIK